jgi:hypothetical protein
MIDMPHIVADGLSLDLIVHDLIKIYQGEALSEPEYNYTDYLAHQRLYLTSLQYQADETFWKSVVHQIPSLPIFKQILLNPAKERQLVPSAYSLSISHDIVEKLTSCARANEMTRFQLMISAFIGAILLTTNSDTTLIKFPSHGRDKEEFVNVVGLMANMTPLNFSTDWRGLSIRNFIQNAVSQIMNVTEHCQMPFVKFIGMLKSYAQNMSRPQPFDAYFNYQFVQHTYSLADGYLTLHPTESEEEDMPLALEVFYDNDNMLLRFRSAIGYFSGAHLKEFAASYQLILDRITSCQWESMLTEPSLQMTL